MGHVDPAGGSNPQDQPRVIPFGKYLLLDRIAVGGMAEVYTAKSFGIEGFEKVIAIKRILPTMAEDQDFISMFIDEAKIAGHLTHANVVPIYELGKIGDSHYIAMEYVWGKDLLQIMNRFRRMRRHMPPVMAAWIASKVLEGLDYAHRKRDRHGRPMGIIHRDVSPQNVLVSYEGQIKLIDFGIAKAASRNTKTQAGVLKGKFGYMSPEQVRGLPIDHRSDIFAASTCLHEMLTGERLFVGESDFSTLEKVRNAEITPPSQLVSDMPSDLEAIVLKGLAREAEERWQTAGEMQEELQRFIALSRPPFGTSKLNTWMRTAFAPELAKEKARLDTFSKVVHPGGGIPQPRVPPALPSVPPPPPPSASPGALADLGGDDDFQGEATMITASPFDAMEEAREAGGPPSGGEELPEEPTQIFFSADDLEEIEEEPSSPSAGGAPAGLPPALPGAAASAGPSTAPMPVGTSPAAAMGSAGTNSPGGASGVQVQPQSSPGFASPGAPSAPPSSDLFAVPPATGSQRRMETVEVDRPAEVASVEEKKSRAGLWIGLAAAGVLFIALLAVGIPTALYVMGSESTGTVSLRVLPDGANGADAVVYVDGVQRGRAPLVLEHVPEGEHALEVRAEGFRTATRQIPVTAGSTAMLEIALERDAPVQVEPPPVAAADPEPEPAEEVAAEAEAEDPEPSADEGVEAEPQDEDDALASAEAVEAQRRADRAPSRPVSRRSPTRPSATTRRSTARRAPRPTPSQPAGGQSHGALTINTVPWARVFLDGRDTGRNTPVRNLRVPAGPHTIGLRTNDGTMHTVQTNVPAGETVRVIRQL